MPTPTMNARTSMTRLPNHLPETVSAPSALREGDARRTEVHLTPTPPRIPQKFGTDNAMLFLRQTMPSLRFATLPLCRGKWSGSRRLLPALRDATPPSAMRIHPSAV